MKSRHTANEASGYEQADEEGASDGTSLAKLMLDPQELCFPLQDTVQPGESGQGYALRMAEENSLSGLPQLKAWLGKSRFAALDAADAPLLHRWFGADVELLEFALGRTATGQRTQGYLYAGQSMGRSYFLNRSYPRVCPACIKEAGQCRTNWDLSLVVACARHGNNLIDRCDYCQRALSWNRPRLGVCGCGMELAMPQVAAATSLEVQFSAWVDGRISQGGDSSRPVNQSEALEMVRPDELTPLMTLLWPLSLDGGLHVAYALGTAGRYDEQRPQTESRLKTPLKKAQQVLMKGNELAEKIARLEPVKLRVSRPSVVVQLLAESACAQGNSADRSLAQSILVAVFQYKKRANWSGLNPHLSQLTLF